MSQINFVFFLLLLNKCLSSKDKDNYKDQYCTDPRTMAKHVAYTEWADAYSCTRHRCQPGGKNLAIYTVGCKRVEAPESAIECEEVVEDTNMQFPYCCTRLRCLVVVRGEVWTKVFGQPWEVLPAAPWSHMYKMKKPPPSDREFVDKPIAAGPVYEIGTDLDTAAAGYNNEKDKYPDTAARAKPSTARQDDDYHKIRRSNVAPAPDIVVVTARSQLEQPRVGAVSNITSIGLYMKSWPDVAQEDSVEEMRTCKCSVREDVYWKSRVVIALETTNNDYQDHKKQITRSKKTRPPTAAPGPDYIEDTEVLSGDKIEDDAEQILDKEHQTGSLEAAEINYKPSNLQDLVEAIGTRMRDIENAVQKMADKVPKKKNDSDREKAETGNKNNRATDQINETPDLTRKRLPKKTSTSGDTSKRFSLRKRNDNKYAKRANNDVTSEGPVVVEERVNGYYSDIANQIVRKEPKEPIQSTYMAPVESRRNNIQYQGETRMPMNDADIEREQESSKRKKRVHKKRRSKTARSHKRQRKDKRKMNKIGSLEADRNIVSIEDGGSVSHVIL